MEQSLSSLHTMCEFDGVINETTCSCALLETNKPRQYYYAEMK